MIVCWFLLSLFYVTDLGLQIWMGVYFYNNPLNLSKVVNKWVKGETVSLPTFVHASALYLLIWAAVGCVLVTIALLVSLVLIYKFNKQAQVDKDGKFNYLMLAYHLCMNVLQFSNLILFCNFLVALTKPNQSCFSVLNLYLTAPYHYMSIFILAMIDQCMSYFMCYKYAVANSKIFQVTTGRPT
jgi:hypothetical protein